MLTIEAMWAKLIIKGDNMATFIGKWDDFKKEVENTPEYVSEEISFRIAMEVNERLKNIGMPKKDFAKSLGVSRPYVSQILQGENNMTILTICKIADALGMRPVIKLFEGEGLAQNSIIEEPFASIDNSHDKSLDEPAAVPI